MEDLEIVYCKDCSSYNCRVVNECSSIHSCNKGNAVDLDYPNLYCHKPCFTKKKQKKSKRR